MIRHTLRYHRQGATLLITVMVVGAVALVIGLFIALRNIDELNAARRLRDALSASGLADGCLQESLLRLWGDKTFAASGSQLFVLDDGTCRIEARAVDGSPVLRDMLVTAVRGRYTERIHALVDMGGSRLVVKEQDRR